MIFQVKIIKKKIKFINYKMKSKQLTKIMNNYNFKMKKFKKIYNKKAKSISI